MAAILSILESSFLVVALFFFAAGTIGVLRFPDLYTRLHALTKCDNLGLGFLCISLVLRNPDVWLALKLGMLWLLAVASSATACYLVGRAALRAGIGPWVATR
jgi:multicomponent Na+:H+ antiporter subunit G